jgi:hypothetical protein
MSESGAVAGRQPGTAAEAIAAVTAGLSYLAQADAVALGTVAVAECLRALETAEALHTAARARMLGAFHRAGGYEPDGSGSTQAWLVWQTKVTRAAARGAVGWMRRLQDHPAVGDALATGSISASWARQICTWTDQLPGASRPDADAILLAAARGGVSLYDLSALAHEMYLRAGSSDSERDPFEDRALYLAQTFRRAGRLEADLTPAASAALRAVLEALGGKAGPEDVRSKPQRDHDALEEACVRLIAAGMLPQRTGQPVHLQLQITLDQLRHLAGNSRAETAWATRATGSGLTATEVQALACDATILPTVTATLDPAALDRLLDFVLTLSQHAAPPPSADGTPGHSQATVTRGLTELDLPPGLHAAHRPPPTLPGLADRAGLRETLLRLAADVLSGPGGLAAALRTQPGQPFPTVSLPLDVGAASEVIPGWLRRLVILRDRHCQFPGCWREPDVCQVHHLIHREHGGATSLANCRLVCRFHHLIAIHRWGWTLTAHADGTVTATHPDGRVLHSHPPPSQAA